MYDENFAGHAAAEDLYFCASSAPNRNTENHLLGGWETVSESMFILHKGVIPKTESKIDKLSATFGCGRCALVRVVRKYMAGRENFSVLAYSIWTIIVRCRPIAPGSSHMPITAMHDD